MKRILNVENDRILSFLLEKQIKRLEYKVVGRVVSGASAIDSVEELDPDFILMDIKLEGDMDEIQATKTVCTFSNAPFVYQTGNSDSNTRQRAKETKPFKYFLKPIDSGVLGQVLSSALA
ncbi:MAG: response regulator, partial [Balneolales bacterium]